MKKFIKRSIIGVVVLLFVVLIALVSVKASFEVRLHKTYSINDEKLNDFQDSLTLIKGQHIAELSCKHCHGEQLQGGVFFNDPALGQIVAPNLTCGEGGVGASYSKLDYIKAIRHGIRKDGTALLIMPADNFCYLTDEDLSALIAYVRQVPAVHSNLPPTTLTPLAKLLMGAGMFGKVLPVESIDHSSYKREVIAPDVTPEFGNYMVSTNGCKTCHGSNLGGGKSPDPASPPAPNLTMGSISIWKESDFIHAMKTGERPGGQSKMSQYMPWNTLGRMNDTELKAVWAYIQSVPKVQPKAQ